MNDRRSEGQTLVFFALILTVLIGFSALVVDVGFKYAAERRYQAVADAASLAGAQDLQARVPNSTAQIRARQDALKAVVDELGAVDGTCPGAGGAASNVDIVDCALEGGQFLVSIRTPSPTCVDCDPDRSVQVTVREPAHPTTFARLFGQTTWNLARTSVAGPVLEKSYALVTLRPPNFRGQSSVDANVDDLSLKGTNTEVNVLSGDVGVNTYVVTNAASLVVLDPGYFIWHFDAGPVGTVDSWNNFSGNPPGKKLSSLIPEPAGYDYRPEYATVTATSAIDPQCATATAGITFPVKLGDVVPSAAAGTLVCYTPGVWPGNKPLKVSLGTAAYLEPGVHIFPNGLDVNDYLYGGLDGNGSSKDGHGVTLVFGADFTAGNAKGIFLNTPSPVAPVTIGGVSIASPDRLPITIAVPTTASTDLCFASQTQPRPVSPTACNAASNPTTSHIKMDGSTGGSNGGPLIQIGGVIWAPTDNVAIGSNWTQQQAYVSRIVAWSVTYNGGATLNQVGVPNERLGPIRIDTACSPGAWQATCN